MWMSGKGFALLNLLPIKAGKDSYSFLYNVIVFGQQCKVCNTYGIKFCDDDSLEICADKLAKKALKQLGY